MPTLFQHRLIVICPLARVAALGTWWSSNIDPADDCASWPKLNPSGSTSDAETHRWCSIALTEPLLRAILVRVCSLVSVTPPTVATWNSWTRAEKRTWLANTRNQLFANTGIWLDLSDGDGNWNDSAQSLTAAGNLKRRQVL